MIPEILTDKILLRIVEKTDVENIHKLRTNPIVSKFIKRDLNKSISDIENFIEERKRTDYYFAIMTLDSNEFAGTIAIWNINEEEKYAELGYELLPNFQGKGLMSNAISNIVHFAFNNLDFNTLEAFTDKSNINSRKLLEKLGFEHQQNRLYEKNVDNVIYQIKK